MRLSVKERIIINLEIFKVILGIRPVPRRWSHKNGLGLYDNSVDLSFYAYFTTVSCDYRVPIRSRPGGDEGGEKKVAGGVSVRAHSHPGSDRNDLNAREASEECRCAYASLARWFIRLWRREIRLCRGWILHGEIPALYVTHRYS